MTSSLTSCSTRCSWISPRKRARRRGRTPFLREPHHSPLHGRCADQKQQTAAPPYGERPPPPPLPPRSNRRLGGGGVLYGRTLRWCPAACTSLRRSIFSSKLIHNSPNLPLSALFAAISAFTPPATALYRPPQAPRSPAARPATSTVPFCPVDGVQPQSLTHRLCRPTSVLSPPLSRVLTVTPGAWWSRSSPAVSLRF